MNSEPNILNHPDGGPNVLWDIEHTIDVVNAIIKSNIFDIKNKGHILVRSAFIDVIICGFQLIKYSEKFSSRVNFVDDVDRCEDVSDVTDLINKIRNLVCHIVSDGHKTYYGDVWEKFTWHIIYGKEKAYSPKGLAYTSDYDDDVKFIFGKYSIYLHRHVLRSLSEAVDNLKLVGK